MSLRKDLEELAVKLERMELQMGELAGERSGQGDERGALHSAGIADGLSIAFIALRTLLERDSVQGHRLERIP